MKFKKLFLSLVFMLLFASPCAFAMRVYQEEETPTKCAKVSIVGNLGSGKTSIYKRILGENVVLEETHNVENQTRMYRQENICKIVNNTVLSIKIWDTPGLSDFHDEIISKLVNNNMIYFVLDITKQYDGDMRAYLRRMCEAIEANNPNCKVVFLFTKYDKISTCMDIAIENSNTKLGIQGLHKDCYFTSSKADFANEDNDFINARYLKSHMINYLRQHINELPDHHETTEIRSDWEIRENEERLTRERDERTQELQARTRERDERIQELQARTQELQARTQERDTLNRELDVQRQVSGELRNENGRLTQELQARTRERDERQETINHRQRVIDWYKERKGWFTGNCPFE